jgi:hypothetical protein
MDLSKLALVAPHAAALTLLVGGLVQWVRFMCDRWHGTLPVWGRTGHVNLNFAQQRFRHVLTKKEPQRENRHSLVCRRVALKSTLRFNFKKGKTMLSLLKVCESFIVHGPLLFLIHISDLSKTISGKS